MKILVPNQPFFDHSSHKRKLEERDGTSQDSQPAAIEANISPDTDSEQQATTETTSQNSADGFPFRHLTNGGVLDGEIAWEIPPGYFRYEFVGEVPHKIRKYYHQRLDLFSLYDWGVRMTDDAWFGVTPESVARKIAEHIEEHAPADKTILIDAFAGAGGNTISFAASDRWQEIIAIDHNAEVLACAKINADIYNVSEKISWHLGDCFEFISKMPQKLREQCVIFASPPWGGPGYTSDPVFNLSTMHPYSLEAIFKPFSEVTKDIALFLPRTSDLQQIADVVPNDEQIDVIQYCVRGATKGMGVYYGGLCPRNWAAVSLAA